MRCCLSKMVLDVNLLCALVTFPCCDKYWTKATKGRVCLFCHSLRGYSPSSLGRHWWQESEQLVTLLGQPESSVDSYKTSRPAPSNVFPPARLNLLTIPWSFKTAPPSGDQVFKHMSRGGVHFHSNPCTLTSPTFYTTWLVSIQA